MPLSKDPAARRRQLENLKRGENPAVEGNDHALLHGARSELLFRDVEGEVRELLDVLAAAAPVRDPDGSLPAADAAAVETAARALKRYRHLAKWCDLHGRLDDRTGEVKPAAEYELRAERALAAALDALGMTPTSRAKLGLDLIRTAAAGAAVAAESEAARQRLDARATDIEVEAER